MDCTFCNKFIERGTGKIYVRKTGKILNFCSMKCEKNMLKLGRKARLTKWVAKEVKNAGKDTSANKA